MSTLTEKILCRKSNRNSLVPGEIIIVDVDIACVDAVQFKAFYETVIELGNKITFPGKIIMVVDHYLPPSTVSQAELVKNLKDFAFRNNIQLHLEGIKHQIFVEYGYATEGALLMATDSHTVTAGAIGAFATAVGPKEVAAILREGKIWLRVPEPVRISINGEVSKGITSFDIALHILGQLRVNGASYKSIELCGSVVEKLNLEERMVLCNILAETGAKAIMVYEEAKNNPECYVENYSFDITHLSSQVSKPYSPDNTVSICDLKEEIKIDQALIGTCAGGNLNDLRLAARVLKDRKVHPSVLFLIIPASKRIYYQALKEGLFEVFLKAGGIILNPNCGPCAGMHQGVLAAGNTLISTQNRNYKGRTGHADSKTYLASPLTVAASAIEGRIVSAERYLQ